MEFSNLLLYCRPGFEKECAAEIMDITAHAGIYGYIKSKPDSGYVIFVSQSECNKDSLNEQLAFRRLVFARQCIYISELTKDLPIEDRISPLLAAIQQMNMSFYDAWLETPDTNEGKQLSSFCKKFSNPFIRSLEKNNLINSNSQWRLHLFFLNSASLYLGVCHLNNNANLHMGIPRLRMPASAPSRSTLKLEEAIKFMLSKKEQAHYLANGMTAVDLGACPGGWTWQLVNRGIRVSAIDNGSMNEQLMATGLVKHIRADGFKYTPEKQVDWMVCDMVERPLHIARLMCRWLTESHCRHVIFNLKLPMKQRYPVVMECKQLIMDELGKHGIKYDLRMKQLYHDREEITCVILTE